MKFITKILALIAALCLLLSLGAFASAEPSGEPSGEASGEASGEGGIAGEYADGLVVAEDGSFTMEQTGANMEGAEFVLTVTGTITEDGKATITGLFDGDIDLVELATEEQKAGNIAAVEAAFAKGKIGASGEPSGEGAAPGTYTDGVNTLVIAEDGTFKMDKTGQNMDGADFTLTVTGTVDADGNFTIDGLYDGDLNVFEMATEEQVAGDLASVIAAYNGGLA